MLAQDFELVILVIKETGADHAEEEIIFLLLLNEFFQSASVRDSEIQISVCNQDHLVVAVFDIIFLSDLIGCFDSRGSIGAAIDFDGQELFQNADAVFISVDGKRLDFHMISGAVGDKAELIAVSELAEDSGDDGLGLFGISAHASGYIQKNNDILPVFYFFPPLDMNVKIFFPIARVHQFIGKTEHLIAGERAFISEIIEHFLDTHHAPVDSALVPELIENYARRCGVGRHPESGRWLGNGSACVLFLDLFILVCGVSHSAGRIQWSCSSDHRRRGCRHKWS